MVKKILLLSIHRFNKDIEIMAKDFCFIYLNPLVQSIFIRIANFDDSYPYQNSILLEKNYSKIFYVLIGFQSLFLRLIGTKRTSQ